MASLKSKLLALKAINDEQYDIEVQYCNELIEIEKKYMNLLKPFWEKRAAVISGKYDNVNDFKNNNIKFEENDEIYPEFNCLSEVKCKGIPDFWITAMLHQPRISENISPMDTKILSFLSDIRIEYLKENANFKLIFDFKAEKEINNEIIKNPYFSNTSLYLDFYYVIDTSHGKAEYTHYAVEGTDILWNDKNYIEEAIKAKSSSFFMIFYPPQASTEDTDIDLNLLNETLDRIFEIGEIFKDYLIPQAIDWYTGKALIYIDDEEWINVNSCSSEDEE